jgi:regulator of sigma E protease
VTALNYLFAFAVLLSVLIFVHELGHFLVAKACGVRVLKFCLGFGPPVRIGRLRLAWKRGHTEYAIAWFPLGGFVKMLGENPDEQDDPETRAHPDETLGSKPLWQKLAIVFAGPAMNLILPVAVFMGTLFVGMPRPDAVVGGIEIGSPAERAGIEAGDRIVAAGGEPVAWWSEVEDRVRALPGGELALEIERGGERRALALPLEERSGLDEFGTSEAVGWAGLGHRRPRAMVGVPDADSPAHAAGLRSGDRIASVGGAPVADWSELARAYAAAPPAGRVAMAVERGPEGAAERIDLEAPALGEVAALGILPANVLVSSVSPDSPAEAAGIRPGDLVLSVDGAPVTSFQSFAETVRGSGGRALDIAYARNGEALRVVIQPELRAIEVGPGLEETRYLVGITAAPATLPGSFAIDRELNPLVSFPRAVQMTVSITGTFLRGLGKILTGEVSRNQVAGPIGIATIAGSSWQQGWETYLSTLVLISINLGILNLLPIPILDGGQALLFLVEGVKRSPLSLRTRLAVQQIGLTVLALLMGMAFWNDISRHWSKVVDWLRSGGL